LSSAVCTSNGARGSLGVPVGAGWNDVVASYTASAEAEVRGGQRTGRGDDASEVASDAAVVASAAAGFVHDVVAEGAHGGVELLEDNGLCLDFADLLRDDPLSHLLDYKETLLNDFNRLTVANDFLLFHYDGLGNFSGEVVRAVEVIESRKRADTMPVVE